MLDIKRKIKNIPRVYKILIICFVVLAILVIIGFKTGIPKSILKQINKPLLEQKEKLESEKESLLKRIKFDSVNSAILLEESIKKGEYFQRQFQKARNLNKEYEKAFSNYNTGDYHNNFRMFSRFVTSRDTLSTDRFNIDN